MKIKWKKHRQKNSSKQFVKNFTKETQESTGKNRILRNFTNHFHLCQTDQSRFLEASLVRQEDGKLKKLASPCIPMYFNIL